MDPRGLTETILRLCGLWLFWLGLEASFGQAAAFVHVLVPDAGAESMPLLMRVWLGGVLGLVLAWLVWGKAARALAWLLVSGLHPAESPEDAWDTLAIGASILALILFLHGAAGVVRALVEAQAASWMPARLGSAFWPSSIPFLLQMVAAVGLFCPLALQRLWHKAMAQRPGR